MIQQVASQEQEHIQCCRRFTYTVVCSARQNSLSCQPRKRYYHYHYHYKPATISIMIKSNGYIYYYRVRERMREPALQLAYQ
eukprot:5071876-Pleurochrysis_carterae.AAC.6